MAEDSVTKRIPDHRIERATSAMTRDAILSFLLPAVQREKVTAAFDGGRITSDGGVMLLAAAERRLGLAGRLAAAADAIAEIVAALRQEFAHLGDGMAGR